MMTLRCCCLVLVLTASVSYAQTPDQVKEADAIARALMQDSALPGLAVTVGQGGVLLWSEGYGYADVEQRVPVWPAITKFRVGSVAKSFTSAAIGQLVEQGRLDLDAPIQRYVPAFPEKQGVITTRLLAGHLAGIRHYQGDENFITDHYSTTLDALSIFQDDPLVAAPGDRFFYSSYGFNLISVILENAAGQEFTAYMQEHVFRPLNMTSTQADLVRDIVSNRSRYYELTDGQLSNSPWVDNSYKWAGGGFLSTTEDMVRFGFAMLDYTLLSAETTELLWTSQRTLAGEETGYGLGWFTEVDAEGDRIVFHTGGSVGGTTMLMLVPARQLVIAAVTNTSRAGLGDIAGRLKRVFAD